MGVGSDTEVVVDHMEGNVPHSIRVHCLFWRELCGGGVGVGVCVGGRTALVSEWGDVEV